MRNTQEDRQELVKLYSTAFTAEGDGPKTADASSNKGWFRTKRKKESVRHGMTTTQPITTVKVSDRDWCLQRDAVCASNFLPTSSV